MSTVVLPERNDKDLAEIPQEAREAIEFRFANHMDQVLDWALLPASKKAKPKKKAGSTKKAGAKARPQAEA